MSSRYSERDYGRFEREDAERGPYGRSGYEPERGYSGRGRGFAERAADEVRSWIGDDDAERRRRLDERYENQGYGREYSRPFMGSYGRSSRTGLMGERSSADTAILVRLSDTDFDIPRDEDIRGRKIYDQAGNEIGKVDDLLIEPNQRRIRFLQVISGGFLGIGGTMMLIPVEAIARISSDRIEIDRTGRATSMSRYDPTLVDWRSSGGTTRFGMMGPHRGRGPRGYKRSDDRIREDVSDRLSDDPYLDASNIDVTVNEGVVNLNGTVRDRTDKRRAEDIALFVPGVQDVIIGLATLPLGVAVADVMTETTTETTGRASGAAAGSRSTRNT